MPLHHVWVLLIAPLAVHLTLVRTAGSMRKVFFLNPVCLEDEVMGKLVHSFCRRRGQGQESHRFHWPEGGEKARAWARGGRYLRGASWRPAARGAATALLWSSRLCRPGLLGARLSSASSSAVALRPSRPPPASSEHARKARAREGSWSTRLRMRRNNQSGASTSWFRPRPAELALPVVQCCACA